MARVPAKDKVVPISLRMSGGWLGFPFSADEIREFAAASKVRVQENADFQAAAEAINEGIQLYAAQMQEVSTASDLKKWFGAVALASTDLIGEFGDSKAERKRAAYHFWERSSLCKPGGFDIERIEALLREIERLSHAAQAAGDSIELKGHRPEGIQDVALIVGFERTWLALTGRGLPPSNTVNGTRDGPFIRFAAKVLAAAAPRLGTSRHPHVAAIAPSLEDLATRPHNICDRYRRLGQQRARDEQRRALKLLIPPSA